MGALGFVMTAAYWPGWISPAFTPKWAILAVAAPAMLLWSGKTTRLTAAHLAGAVTISWMALTIAWSRAPLDSLNALWLFCLLPAVCFLLGMQAGSLRPVLIGSAWGLGISSVIAIAQVLGWDGLASAALPSGLFVNRDFLAETAALVAVGLMAERLWWHLPLVAPALVLPMDRTALLACVVALAALMWRARNRASWAILAALAGCFAYAALHIGSASLAMRLAIWRDAVAGISLTGHGLGIFWTIPTLYNGTTPIHAHNEFIEIVWECGLVGLALAASFAWTLRGPIDTARAVLVALAVECVLAFPLHLPVTVALGAMCAGFAVRDRAVVRGFALRGRAIRGHGMAAA
jgi:hypothetical protein